jgi:hypothetical protein
MFRRTFCLHLQTSPRVVTPCSVVVGYQRDSEDHAASIEDDDLDLNLHHLEDLKYRLNLTTQSESVLIFAKLT